MSTTTCPNGHASSDPEWCDTCGAKMGGTPSGSPSSAVPPPTTSSPAPSASGDGPVTCPHCAELNPSDALFCEVCGYDFTTGQSPAVSESAAPVAVEPVDSAVGWIAVIEVDQQWYGLKGALADQACPKTSSSTVPLSNHTALIGRSSASRGLRPEIALDADTGVSRRHAQFVRDGDSLTVVDLSSTNGTYVVAADTDPDTATMALVPGVPTELRDGDRVYVGAWTRLTVRSQSA
ncbi:MAG TPA: FHA domain-containing protein [Ilumatobacteraceae bacterium]|nr:FHA domain-containing protein [Ilumatobacteraceae bacterium]HRB02202.1 FHA domain-containing protein [Ilumatobacteraceae bacterium]